MLSALIALFEKYKSVEGLFFYLGSVVNYSQVGIFLKELVLWLVNRCLAGP